MCNNINKMHNIDTHNLQLNISTLTRFIPLRLIFNSAIPEDDPKSIETVRFVVFLNVNYI